MNAVEIEEAISRADQPLDAGNFRIAFLEVVGNKATMIKWPRVVAIEPLETAINLTNAETRANARCLTQTALQVFLQRIKGAR